MSILRQHTQAEADLLAKENLILRAAEATHHLASVLQSCNEVLWRLPTDRLLAVLNADLAATFATFEANDLLGMAVNDSLNAVGVSQFTTRAPVEPGRTDIIFDGQAFVLVPPETEPEIVET
jgi:hypothetical protein